MGTSAENELKDLLAKFDALAQRQEADRNEIQELRLHVLSMLSPEQLAAEALAPTLPDVPAPAAAAPTPPTSSSALFQSLVNNSAEVSAAANAAATAATEAPTPRAAAAPDIVKAAVNPNVKSASTVPSKAPRANTNLEKFIGENLINKIGILITILGVAVGARYAIEHELISPLTRIVLGYLLGIGLFFTAGRLRAKYEAFSAVLLSGAMAILYFISYAAYTFYALIPQTVAFALMVLFTVYTVVAALQYKKQVIAIIGLVGAYAVPVLLSDGSGRVEILFSYMVIINLGILYIAWKQQWTELTSLAIILSWIIYLSWFLPGYRVYDRYAVATTFCALFFAVFYLATLGLYRSAKPAFAQIALLLLGLNALIAYGVGMKLLAFDDQLKAYQGLFTVCNAVVHFVVLRLVYRKGDATRTLFTTVAALVLFFITIAIPVQLHGSWISVAWAFEGLLISVLGTRLSMKHSQSLALFVMFIAMLSVFGDWSHQAANLRSYYNYTANITQLSTVRPFLNGEFLSMLCVIACLSWWLITNARMPRVESDTTGNQRRNFSIAASAVILTVVSYGSIHLQINGYFQQWSDANSVGGSTYDWALYDIWPLQLLNYTLAFLAVLNVLGARFVSHLRARLLLVIISTLALFVVLTHGMSMCLALTYDYIGSADYFVYNPDNSNSVHQQLVVHSGQLLYRYLTFALTGLLMWSMSRLLVALHPTWKRLFTYAKHIAAVIILSNELLHWLNLWHIANADRSAMSILWGIYSLLLIAYGIQRKLKQERLIAIALFALTLLKLFVYDLNELGTMAKTVAFIGLGLLLLVISFLYNKYKSHIFDDGDEVIAHDTAAAVEPDTIDKDNDTHDA